jgi:two-component system, sensor histidine kinase and response regulator
MQLQTRLFLIIALSFASAFAGLGFLGYQRVKDDVRQEMMQLAEQIRGVLMSTRRVYHRQFLDSGIELTPKTLGFLPAHSLARISRDFVNWSDLNLSFNNVSDRPRNPDNAADEIEIVAIRHFRQNSKEKLRFVEFTSTEGVPFFHYSRPIWVEQYCLKCHGKQADAPVTIRNTYNTSYDYQVGELRGIMSIKIPATKVKKKMVAAFLQDALTHLVMFLLISIPIGLVIRRYVTLPLAELDRGMVAISAGEYEKKVGDLEGDFAKIARTFNMMGNEILKNHSVIKESESRYSLVESAANDGVWDWNILTGEDYLSPRWKGILGYRDDELPNVQETFFNAIHPDDQSFVGEAVRKHLEENELYSIEFRMQHKDGSSRWVLSRGEAIRDDGNRPVRMVGSITDITKRKEVEDALRNSEKKFLRLFMEVSIPLCFVDQKGVLVHINKRFTKLFGYTLSDVPSLDEWWRQAYPDEKYRKWVIDTWELAVQSALEIGVDIEPIEYEVTYKSGEVRTILIGGVIFGNNFLATFIDVTEHKKSEYALQKAKEDAEYANRAKSAFLAHMSHEIRTPMNAIFGMEEVLAESKLDDEQRSYLNVLTSASENLLALINDILDISKIESGQLDLDQTPFSLYKTVEEVFSIQTIQAKKKDIRLTKQITENVPKSIFGDALRFKQILLNLMNNAIKFTNQGYVAIVVDRPDDGMLQVTVTDTGIGIPPEMLTTIFNPFTQAESSTTRRYGGTGLGLNICQQLVGLMGGRIWVESEIGKGSSFHFTIPLIVADEVVLDDVKQPKNAEPDTIASQQKIKEHPSILLVDDAEENCMVIQAFLKNTDYQLVLAFDGEEGLEKAKSGQFDLILMDVQMPIMDGYEATRKIRGWEGELGRRRIPIIALTANAMKEDIDHAHDAGCDRYLTKPVRKQILMDTIAAVLTLGKQ